MTVEEPRMAGTSIRLAKCPEPSWATQIAPSGRLPLDFRGSPLWFAQPLKSERPMRAKLQTAYRRRTQAHRRGWLRPSQIQAVCMGPQALFYFSKPTDESRANSSASGANHERQGHDPNQMTGSNGRAR
jgi:hypothetical protein